MFRRTTKRARRARRSLSVVRLAVALIVVGACGAGATVAVRNAVDIGAKAGAGPWFAPYVDVTATPEFHFEAPSSNPARMAVLGFVVAPRTRKCVPTWGTYYDLGHASVDLDMDRRVARLRDHGGGLIISFGGAANDELALDCNDVPQLTGAYSAVISRYDLNTIDFDIEGAALANAAANDRRAAATARLQHDAGAAGRRLAVWLTLPVAPTGMPDAALGVIDSMLRAHVDLAGVNLMTMDYGSSRVTTGPNARDMVQATAGALDASFTQLDGVFRRAGIRLTTKALWSKIGMTPMIGQNDEPGDQISVHDATRLTKLAVTRGLGRISMWSLNRDTACGAQLDVGTVSDSCSGISQKPLAFSNVFLQLRSQAPDVASTPAPSAVQTDTPDDPAHSPYPIWSDAKTYVAGDKVTWHHNVYEAKWWSQQNVPDDPVPHEWNTPWRYLGPVMKGDHPPTTVPLKKGTYPEWRAATAYVKGDRVQVGGTAYEANWWTQGDRPDKVVDHPWDSPWVEIQNPTHTTPGG